MFWTKKDKRTALEKEIDNLAEEMRSVDPSSERYETMAKNLETLSKAKSYEKSKKVSPDTIAVVAANLIGIGLILFHEQAHIVTSKALGFVLRGRV